jgi:hypothetical protein
MVRRKLKPIITPNTLESMIEYTLISSILDRICEMTKETMEYPRDESQPLCQIMIFMTRTLKNYAFYNHFYHGHGQGWS